MLTIAMLYDSILDTGGVESHLLSLLSKRDPERFAYIVYSPTSDRFAKKVESTGSRVVRIPRRHPLNPITPIETAAMLKGEEVDLVHAHSPTAALWGRIAAQRLDLPVVVTVHLPVERYHGVRMTARARLGRWMYGKLDRWMNHHPRYTRRIIYVAQGVYEKEIENGHAPRNISMVIANGIDLKPYSQINRQEARQGFNLRPEVKVVTFVGRLDEQKGVDILIDAVSLIPPTETHLNVWIVGDGALRPALESQAKRLGLSERIKFWGHQENIPELLKASDLFVLSSRYEGMSISLLHALAAGIPCVVTRVGDNDRVVKNGVNGLVVPPEDSQSLAKALEMILQDEELHARMSAAALETAYLHSEDDMVKQVEQVYNECLSE